MKTANLVLTLTSVISITFTHAKIDCRRSDERGSSWHHSALGRFGDYSCDSPLELIESAARHMRTRHSENVEFVLWTGDIIASHFNSNAVEKYQAIRNMTDLLSRTFSSHFVFPVLGHLDPMASDNLTHLWMHWLPLEALQTFKNGGYYTIEQSHSKLRIVALNTNLFAGRESNSVHARRQWEWLEAVLDKAASKREMILSILSFLGTGSYQTIVGQDWLVPLSQPSISRCLEEVVEALQKLLQIYVKFPTTQEERNRVKIGFYEKFGFPGIIGCIDGTLVAIAAPRSHPSEAAFFGRKGYHAINAGIVYIVGHAPPGANSRHGHSAYSPDSNAKYLRTVRNFARIIAGQFFGHLHADTFRVIYDNDQPVSWVLLAPSVSPNRDISGSSNPGLRLYKFDTNSGKVLDYTQYYLDLSAANRAGVAEWVAEYNLTQYYGLHDISSQSLHILADKLRISTPHETTFHKYLRAYSAKQENSESCDGACAHQHFCAITCLEHLSYRQCVEAAASALAALGKSTSLIVTLDNQLITLVAIIIAMWF